MVLLELVRNLNSVFRTLISMTWSSAPDAGPAWKEGRAPGALACRVLAACRAWTHSRAIKAVVSVVSEREAVRMAAADARVSQACLGPAACLLGSSSALEAKEMD